MKYRIFYCYDAYCGWCYGFSPVIYKLWERYHERLDFEVLSGGMILSDPPQHIGVMADFIKSAVPTVEGRTGIRFGQDFLWHINNSEESDWFPYSEKPAIAMCIFKEYFPGKQIPFAKDLQYALKYEGRDLCDDEAYRHLVAKYDLPEEAFYRKLKDEAYKEKAHYEFALCKQLQVSGFPTVFIQAQETKFYLLARGYTDYDTLQQRLENVLAEIAANPAQKDDV